MILVDSSVWIDYLSAKVSRPENKIDPLTRPDNQAVVTGIIIQEILQGIRNLRSFELTRKMMTSFPVVIPSASTHASAAALYQEVMRKGNQVSTVDALIAALAIEHRLPLYTFDADFQNIAKHTRLQLFY